MPKPYTFFKHDGTSVPPVFDLAECADDREAIAYARRLLAEGQQYEAVEIWDGRDEPFSVLRSEMRLPSRPKEARSFGPMAPVSRSSDERPG